MIKCSCLPSGRDFYYLNHISLNNYRNANIDGLVQNSSISSAYALEILQSCNKPSIYLNESCQKFSKRFELMFDVPIFLRQSSSRLNPASMDTACGEHRDPTSTFNVDFLLLFFLRPLGTVAKDRKNFFNGACHPMTPTLLYLRIPEKHSLSVFNLTYIYMFKN